MKTTLAFLATLFGVLLVVVGIGWFFQSNDLAMSAFFSPKYEQVRYNTFKNSQAYNDSKAGDLQKDELEWATATPDAKAVIRGVVLAQFASYNENMLPPHEYAFLQEVRNYDPNADTTKH